MYRSKPFILRSQLPYCLLRRVISKDHTNLISSFHNALSCFQPRQRQPEPQMFRETFSSSVFSKDTLPRRNFIDEVDEESDEEDCYWGED